MIFDARAKRLLGAVLVLNFAFHTNPQNLFGQGRRGRVSDVYTRCTQVSDEEPNDARPNFQDWYRWGEALASGTLSGGERQRQQVVYVNKETEPPSMDPTKQADAVSGFWLGHLCEGLMTTGPQGQIVPGVAEKIDVSRDGKIYTFTLRKNALWHDGTPVTATDFVFAFRRLVDPAYASQYASIAVTGQIKGAAAIISGKSPIEDLGVVAISDRVLQITLNNPVVFFPALMAFQTFFPVRADFVNQHRERFATSPETFVCNGPFRLASWKKEHSMRIERAPTYWNKEAIGLNAIEMPMMIKDVGASYNLFATAGLDIMNVDGERLAVAARDRRVIKTYNDGAVYYLELNQRPEKVFANINLRKAIQYALNKRELINKVVALPGNDPVENIIPNYMPGPRSDRTFRQDFEPLKPIHNKDKAKEFLKKYLKETNQTSVPAFGILCSDGSESRRMAEWLQQNLSVTLGAKIRIESIPFKSRLQRMRDGQFDLVIAGWSPDYLDPATFMDLFLSGNDNNRGGFSHEKYDELVHKALIENNPQRRAGLFAEAEGVLHDTAGIVPLFTRGRAYIVQPQLRGVKRNVVGQDPDFRFAKWQD